MQRRRAEERDDQQAPGLSLSPWFDVLLLRVRNAQAAGGESVMALKQRPHAEISRLVGKSGTCDFVARPYTLRV